MIKREANPNITRIIDGILCLAFLVPLVGYGLNAITFRYNGDDYCYLSVLNANGFLKTQAVSYLQGMPYSGDRYAATFISDGLKLISPGHYGVVTVGLLVIWVLSAWWALGNLRVFSEKIKLPRLTAVWLSEAVVAMTLYEAPNITQSVYWRAGQIAYLVPIVGICLDVGLILSMVTWQKFRWAGCLALLLLTVIVGGVSETGAAVQAVVCLALLFYFLAAMRSAKGSSGAWIPGVALLGSCVALVLLMVSPGNQSRLKIVKTIPDVGSLVSITSKYTFDFIAGSLRGQPLPIFVILAMAMLMVILILADLKSDGLNLRTLGIVGASSMVIAVILVASCIAPSVYGESGYPESRVLLIARWFVVLETFFLGGVLGGMVYSLARKVRIKPFVQSFALLCLLLLAIYPVYFSRGIYAQFPGRQSLASAWDLRDQKIRQQKASGSLAIEIAAIDHMVQGVADFSADSTNWYNSCAAGYYGVQTISAK